MLKGVPFFGKPDLVKRVFKSPKCAFAPQRRGKNIAFLGIRYAFREVRHYVILV
jgi:hypothetical protein